MHFSLYSLLLLLNLQGGWGGGSPYQPAGGQPETIASLFDVCSCKKNSKEFELMVTIEKIPRYSENYFHVLRNNTNISTPFCF